MVVRMVLHIEPHYSIQQKTILIVIIKQKKYMNTNLLKHWLFLIAIFLTNISSNSQTPYQNSSIVSTWISEEDVNWKLIFTTSNKCYQYDKNTLIETDTFSISNTTPQCGITVPIDNYTKYLQLKNVLSGDITCYEINGITSASLSLRVIDKGGSMVFIRQIP